MIKALHINCKELLAVYYLLRSLKIYFKKNFFFSHSQVGVQIINKMGTSKSSICNDIKKNIWFFGVASKIWITAAHIPGAENVIADYESRKSYIDSEWMQKPSRYKKAIEYQKFESDIHCFSSSLNTKQSKYIFYKPDIFAYLTDVYSVNWGSYNLYISSF